MPTSEAVTTSNDALINELKEIRNVLSEIKTELENIGHYPKHFTEEILNAIRAGTKHLETLVDQGSDQRMD